MQLKGVITSMPTPFNENLTVSEETLVDEITYHLSSGIHGLCLLGGTGEFLSLTDDERKNVVELGVKTVNGKIPVVAGCFLPLPEQMLSLASDFAALGADAIMLTPPAFYKLNSYHFEKFLDTLFEKLSIPVVIYNAPGRVSVNFTSDEMGALVKKFPNVVGVKDASANMVQIAQMAVQFPERCALLQAIDELFLPSLAVGGKGGIIAAATIFPEIFVAIYENTLTGDLQKPMSLHHKVVQLMRVLDLHPMPVMVKHAMTLVGRSMGSTREPLYPVTDKDIRLLEETLGLF